jgi:hypothetical protein
MADEVFGFTIEDIRRIRKAVAFTESFQVKQTMRRPQMPATAEGISYIVGTLTEDMPFNNTADITLDDALDDGTTEITVLGIAFSALDGDKIGALYYPPDEVYHAIWKVCEDVEEEEDEDGGSAEGGGDTEDGGTPEDPDGDLDGGTP